MRPSKVLRRAEEYLARHGVESPGETAELLLADVLRTDRAGLYARVAGLTQREAKAFGRALCQRCTGTPVQHLTGRQQFRRLELLVEPGVFVPRPETELLVDAVLEVMPSEAPVVVDVGTGTGAVALAVKDERPDASVYATDVTPEAVMLARRNANRLSLDVAVLQGDLLGPLPRDLAGRVDLVVSNPPYVSADDYASLPPEVRADPDIALLGGTEVHGRLVEEAPRWLCPGGSLVVEIGADQGQEVADLFRTRFGQVRVLQDLVGRDRVVAGRLPQAAA